jgi:endonuclease/exonuclease/phosphatase family metal-dependent hydrolase
MGNAASNFPVNTSSITPFVFDPSSNQWADASKLVKPVEFRKINRKLNIATLNVWFGEFAQKERTLHQFQLFEKQALDIACLQEITPTYAYNFLQSPWARKNCWCSLRSEKAIVSYGVMMIGKLDVLPDAIFLSQLPSEMGRDLLLAKFDNLTVATVHLESLNSGPTRKLQLQKIVEILGKEPNVLLMGDFNFDEYHSYKDIEAIRAKRRFGGNKKELVKDLPANDPKTLENNVLQEVLPEFKDLWKVFHPNDLGYTFDTEANKMLRNYEQMRYDRIVAKLGSQWSADSIELFAHQCLDLNQTGGEVVFPSDHFGLLATFSLH